MFLHVFLFFHDFIGFQCFNHGKEIWEVLVDFDHILFHGETVLAEVVFHYKLNEGQYHCAECHQQNGSGPDYLGLKIVLRFHHIKASLDVHGFSFEDLSVTDNPVSIAKHHQWSKFKQFDCVLRQLVVQSRWESHLIGNDYALSKPLVEKVEGCKGEEERHSDTIQHSNIYHIDNT